MAFEKVKTLRAAEKHLEMGKIPAAIKEYCKIVEDDPSDFTTLNILGDLHVRTGNPAAAISCFRRIAEHYREQEFALKIRDARLGLCCGFGLAGLCRCLGWLRLRKRALAR